MQELLIKKRTNWIKTHNVELQFWGYEFGNILAAIAGVGGFFAVVNSLGTVGSVPSTTDTNSILSFGRLPGGVAELLKQQPDLAVTVCIGIIVLVAPLLRKAIKKLTSGLALEAYDYSVVILAMLVLLFALRTDTS